MSSDNWDHGLFELMKAENKVLTEVLAEIQRVLGREDRTKNQVDDLLSRLCDLVETHFCNQEQGGYLKSVLEQAPGMATQARTLLGQQEALLNDLEKLRLLGHSGVESPAWWIRIQSDLHKLATQLLQHVDAETKILAGASSKDFGRGD
jgi:ABC-type transporter Mla subunit MlaD